MPQIKAVPKKDFARLVEITSNAYPGFGINSPEEKERAQKWLWKVEKEDPAVNVFGYYDKNELNALIRLFSYRMNFDGIPIPCGGGGLLAVDLLHKKEHIAKKLMIYFLDYFRKKDCYLSALYPFRPDFYHKMGFGYGTKFNQYVIKPGNLPKNSSRNNITALTAKDVPAMEKCYNRIGDKTHGMFKRCKYENMRYRGPRYKLVGYKKGRNINGYIAFEFNVNKNESELLHDIKIFEMFYENREVLSQLLAWLRSQSDQVRNIYFGNTDDDFHFIPFDPRDNSEQLIAGINHQTNRQGIGLMYRIHDIGSFFRQLKKRNFNNQTCALKINIEDSLYPGNAGTYYFNFKNGAIIFPKDKKFEVEISIDIAEFSSMVMGIIGFDKLYNYNLAEISDTAYIKTVADIFKTSTKPYCVSQF